ncbi:hypothetical protein [Compostimonas suwonensis]|uniref:Uncharacterized protein n=1 Tax=Compostimonas suwonensis TaxID=1048394 RepID=A0A2M9C060_9MICO|nr:hypothetical protein [Compostimonas suwonensis]PJJ63731.1 hypothetical protein CLV54_1405 [Compostimonas suwonensis]
MEHTYEATSEAEPTHAPRGAEPDEARRRLARELDENVARRLALAAQKLEELTLRQKWEDRAEPSGLDEVTAALRDALRRVQEISATIRG